VPLIDYFTTFSQIINFMVLVFLLRHFLYRPVIKAMDEREQKIASRLKEADQKKAEAEQAAESYRKTERRC
jgi:F-type H+-transporting ATPase subunit b